MKVELSTRKGDISVELNSEQERLTFVEKLPVLINSKQFVSALLIEEEGEAKFDTLEGLLKALENYED